jgi:hypothetical protein
LEIVMKPPRRPSRSAASALRRYLLVTCAALLVSCATEPDTLDRARPEAVAKSIFQGTWYYNLTVTDAEWDNRYTFIGEQSNTYRGKPVKLRWEITETHLNGYMVPQAYRDADGKVVHNDKLHQKSLILSFPIRDHFDIRYRYNPTTREELPILEENRDRPWSEREYVKVDWSRSLATNIWAPTGQDVASGALVRDPAGFESIEFFAKDPAGGADDVRVDARSYRAGKSPEVYAINIDTKESFSTKLSHWLQLYYGSYMEPSTVRFRHSLLKAKDLDQRQYAPLSYPDTFFRRFGFFRTEYEVYDPIRHRPIESQKKYFANRWDLSGQKKIVWTFSPSMQEAIDDGDTQLETIVKEICGAYNKVLREATGRKDEIMVVRKNELLRDAEGQPLTRGDGTQRWKYELGDLRYSFINITFKQSISQPLGYGPVMPDPDTGQILQATANIYGGWAEWVIQRALDQYDVTAGNCTLEDIKAGRHFDEYSGKCDRGPQGAVDDGPVTAFGQSAMVGDTPHVLGSGSQKPRSLATHAHQMLTPALRTAYYPKAGVRAVKRLAEVQASLKKARPQLEALHRAQLKRPMKLDLGGFATVKGHAHERSLLPGGNLHSLLPYAQDPGDADVLAQLSPASRLSSAALAELRAASIKQLAHRDEPTMFEPAIHAFVGEMKGKPRAEVVKRLRHWIYYTTLMHEMGHCVGLRHNFAASADRRNYSKGYEKAYNSYWDQVETLRGQYKAKIDKGDAQAYEAYVRAVDALPSTHDRYASSSIMDYVGDWMDWTSPLRSYDRAALLFAYGEKVEVKEGQGYTLASYKPGDFEIKDPFDLAALPKSGRPVRHYLFCSDEKVYDDAFCTPFDRGSTATEIVRNFIKASQSSYIFSNFKRDRTGFDNARRGYYMRKWLRGYYLFAKPFTQITVNNIRYPEFWSSLFDGISAIGAGPEGRNMKPGYFRDGGEDLLRASLLYYSFLLYDVLMRPDYGHYQLARDSKGELYWDHTKSRFLDNAKPSVFIPAGVGWGFSDRWDVQQDPQRHQVFLKRVGVELDKVIALEILSIPAVFNNPLSYEKANGTSFWNSLWTNNGHQLWEVVRGLVTDNFAHQQNPWCLKCDAACQQDPEKHPPTLEVHPIDHLEGLARGGLLTNYPLPTGKHRCGPDAQPIKPGMDDLFAIKPIFYSIAGASHPWYYNALSERLDSQVKGGHHRFDIPAGAKVAEFVNPSGTKTYQAVQTTDGLSVSYALVDNARRITNRIKLVDACLAGLPTAALENTPGTHGRTCDQVKLCYDGARQAWCDQEGWDSSFTLDALKYRAVDRAEAMLIMMQDMVDIAGHYAWRVPGYLSE